jgi:hypothetical protein
MYKSKNRIRKETAMRELRKLPGFRLSYLGIYLGYPMCCVYHFNMMLESNNPGYPGIAKKEEIPEGVYGKGFRPCAHCAKTKTAEQLFTEIRINRVSRLPFPNHEWTSEEVQHFIGYCEKMSSPELRPLP